MLKKTITTLDDYFIGNNIMNYYSKKAKEDSENFNTYQKDRDKYIIKGKMLPNMISSIGVTVVFTGNPLGTIAILAGEYIRNKYSKAHKKQIK